MNDSVIQFEGTVYEEGYGLIAQKAMRDKNLPPKAKLIYAYMCSFAGVSKNGERTAFPSISLQCHELGISEDTYYKWRKPLIDHGYIKITRQRQEGAKFDKNIYSIVAVPVPVKAEKEEEKPYPKNSGKDCKPYPKFPSTENPCTENAGTNINSLNINNFNNKKDDDDEKLSHVENLTDFFTKNISPTAKQLIASKFIAWLGILPYEVIKLELENCALHGAKSWKYVEKALLGLKAANVTTIEQLEQKHAEHQTKSTGKNQKAFKGQSKPKRQEYLPDWFQENEENNGGARAAAENVENQEIEAKKRAIEEKLKAFRK